MRFNCSYIYIIESLNDNTSYINGSNFSGVGGSSTIGPNSTGLSTNKIYKNGAGSSSAFNLDQNSTRSFEQQQAENNMEIISEIKHMPYDELKKKLMRSNKLYTEKYQQVFDFISKEHSSSNANVILSNGINPNVSLGNNSINNSNQMNGSSGNLSNASNQSTSMNSGISIKESYQQKAFPLNDIEFPQLFMY